MSNFMIGCFILGAATVGLIHGQWGSLIGIVAVLLWFTGLVRAGSNVLSQFLTIGAVSMTVLYAYQEFAKGVSETVVIVVIAMSISLVIASMVLWIRALAAARREEKLADAHETTKPERRRPTKWWAEVLALLIFAGIPFAIGAAAAQSNFNDEREARDLVP